MKVPAKTVLASLLLLLFVFFAQGCAVDAPPEEALEVGTSWSELSSKQALLTPAQMKRLETDLTKAAAATKAEIEELTKKIEVEEASHKKALAEIESLLSQIRARRAQLESNRNTATAGSFFGGLFGFLVGGPVGMVIGAGAVGAGAYAINTDSQLRALDQSLASAESRKATAQQNLAKYTSRKAELEKKLDDLETREGTIRQVLAKSAKKSSAKPAAPFASYPNIPKRARKARLLGELLENLVQQRATLGEILTLAQGVSAELGVLVTDLEKLRDEADEMVAKSNADLFKILAVMTAADPMAAATAWLEASIASRAKEVLEDLDIPVLDFAMFLVDVWDQGQSFAANPTDAAKKAIVDQVVNAINTATEAPNWSAVKYTEKQLIELALDR